MVATPAVPHIVESREPTSVDDDGVARRARV